MAALAEVLGHILELLTLRPSEVLGPGGFTRPSASEARRGALLLTVPLAFTLAVVALFLWLAL